LTQRIVLKNKMEEKIEISELEIKLYNITLKFLNMIVNEKKYNGALDAIIHKNLESDKYGVRIGIKSNLSEERRYNCSLKYYENYRNQYGVKILFGCSTEEKSYNKKYREYILKEIPECEKMELK